jgi:hypothetical protein
MYLSFIPVKMGLTSEFFCGKKIFLGFVFQIDFQRQKSL